VNSDQLENLVRVGKLVKEAPSRSEFEGLANSARSRLQDAQRSDLSLDSRFDLASNAAHALSLAALRWHGYRSDSRYLVFQCLKHTVGLHDEEWRILDEAHRKRNLAEYEGTVDVEIALVESMIRVTVKINETVSALEPPGKG